MFKYTPKKQILREMEVAKTGRWWDKEYHKRDEILANAGLGRDYTLNVVLKKHYPTVVFYSETLVREVPVLGFLFPESMFDVEKV